MLNPTKTSKRFDPLSAAVSRIVQIALQEESTLSDLAETAESDPSFALRVLSYVNNPILGLGRRVDNIHEAATLLGLRGLRSLALSLVITHLTTETVGTETLLANCLRRAVTAQRIAKITRLNDPESCFALGLFLDCGLLISAKENARSAIAIGSSPACFRLIRERAVGFRMHPDLGAVMAKNHGLNDEFVEAILRHHGLTCPITPLARIAWVAERVAAIFEGDYYANARSLAEEALIYLGISTQELDELQEIIPEAVVELSTVFAHYVGPQHKIDACRAPPEERIAAIASQYETLVSTLESLVRVKEGLEIGLRNANGRLEELATTDYLTGLCNRRALQTALDRDLSRADRAGSDLSVLLIDIDHFGAVNATWGTSVGDAVLTHASRVILGLLRSGDVAGRYGGEEFLVILPSTKPNGALVVAERMRVALAQNAITGPEGPIAITCSIGLSHERGPGCRTAQDRLLRRAEQALHAAKHDGRDRVTLAS